ncbi:MAG: CHAD domain-containing protein [Candidatus Competibacteraceae bacterium]|nr:CHAD domain-containing protein [Candidatus Competibacteraceae bacterium]
MRAALEEPHYPLLLQQVAGWLGCRAWRDDLTDSRRNRLEEPVLKFATPLLEDDYRRVLKRGEDFARLTAEERHALRIRIKELRYALDFFASLYPVAPVKPFLGALAKLQDDLGVMNDIAVTRRLLDEARLSTVSAARQVIDGWYGCRLDVHEYQFAESWRHFVDCERPWKD